MNNSSAQSIQPTDTDTPAKPKRLSWAKRINLLFLGLVLATGIKVAIEMVVDAPIPPSSFPEVGGNFTLNSSSGPVSLGEFKNKVVLLSFGYTHCPDVCPATLSNISAALRLLKQSEDLANVQTLFVTLDHERDSVDDVATYVDYFHSNMIGLTGSEEELRQVTNQYKVGFQKDEIDSKGGYTMSHLSYIFVIRPDNQIGELLSHTTPPKEIVEAVRHWLPWSES